MKKPTIKDIARKLGLAHSTVSMVMNNKGAISEETKAKVMAAARQMGYEPNLFARALKSGRTNRIAVVIQNFGSAFAAGALSGIEKKIRGYGYDLSVYSEDSDIDVFVKILKEKLADAVIVVTVAVKPDVVEAYAAAGVPLVLIEEDCGGKASFAVLLDNKKAAYDATEYLLKKGKRKIGLLNGKRKRLYAGERLEGYKLALADYGVRFNEELIYEFGMHYFSDGVDGYAHLKRKNLDAVFSAGGDTVAAGFMSGMQKDGQKPGRDIAVVGFDDIPIAEALGITTVKQPFEEIGLKALGLAVDALCDPRKEKRTAFFEGKLIVRATA